MVSKLLNTLLEKQRLLTDNVMCKLKELEMQLALMDDIITEIRVIKSAPWKDIPEPDDCDT